MPKYARTLDELQQKAVRFWARTITEQEANVSVLPLLLKTQDKFISVLALADASPDTWKKLVDVSNEMKANLFLKHLMVLSDLGGEALNKITPLSKYFQDGSMRFIWREQEFEYRFQQIQNKTALANSSLKVDGESLFTGQTLTPKLEDVIMLLLYGGASFSDNLPDDLRNKCIIGTLIGNPAELNNFVKQSYIRVSRQISGATNNALGHLAQTFVLDELRKYLPDWKLKEDGRLPNVRHGDDETETTFDVTAKSPNGKHFGIEVSFQVTTNSVIERKAREAQSRQKLVHDAGHYIAYVIDGAGNIDVRKKAVGIICNYSDCTVALSAEEIEVLADFMLSEANS